MNFGAVDGVSLRSGYALPACRPVNGGFINRRTVHLSKPKRCLDKPGHLFTTGALGAGSILSGGSVAARTVVLSQLTGTANGTGTYQINNSQTVGSANINANKSVFFRNLESLDYGTSTRGTNPATGAIGDGNVYETFEGGTQLLTKSTTNNTNLFSTLQVNNSVSNPASQLIGGDVAHSIVGIISNNVTGTVTGGGSFGTWAILGQTNVTGSQGDNYGLASSVTVQPGASGWAGGLYAQTIDQVGTSGHMGAAEIDLFTFNDDPISNAEPYTGLRSVAMFQALPTAGQTTSQASRIVTASSGIGTTSAGGAFFYAYGSCYYAVFDATQITPLSGYTVAGVRLPMNLGIDFSVVSGNGATLNNRLLVYNSSTGSLEYQVNETGPATTAVVSITDSGVVSASQFAAPGAIAQAPATVSYASSFSPAFATQANYIMTLTGNITLSNPASVLPGSRGFILLIQDTTGGRTISFGSSYVFAAGTAPVLSIAANDQDLLQYIVISATSILLTITKNIKT